MDGRVIEDLEPVEQIDTAKSSTLATKPNDLARKLKPTPPPASIGGYRILHRVGSGAMGVVYVARDEVLGRRVAVKVLSHRFFQAPEQIGRFLREARMLARFNHPNIVTVYSAGEEGANAYLAMEYVDGQTLRQRMWEEKLQVAEAQRVGLGIAMALQDAHRQRVCHGDLKPENVMIDRGGRPRAVDFGLSRMVSDAQRRGNTPSDGCEQAANANATDPEVPTGGRADDFGKQTVRFSGAASWSAGSAVRGTPMYLAPEQWNGVPGDTAVDMWAFGVMMYEMLVGRHPYEDAWHSHNLAREVTASTGPPRVETRADVSAELANAVHGCLAKEPGSRPSAEEMVSVLNRLVHSAGNEFRLQECPFRGLDAFSERHSHFFFGRNEEIESFVERIRVQPVMPVVGASGVGKSSFVQAGVIPRLRELRDWTVIRMRPGKDPFSVLARALGSQDTRTCSERNAMATTAAAPSEPLLPDVLELTAQLLEKPKRLAAVLAERARSERVSVLLLVDQLEEVATMVADPGVRDRFLDAICGAADDRHEPVRVVFTVRDDFLSRLAGTRSMRRALETVTVLQRPGKQALTEIMTLPLQVSGYRYDDDSLVAAMVEQVVQEAAALPLLQFTASLLWQRRDTNAKCLCRCDYDAIGGIQGALAFHADQALHQLDVDDVQVVRGAMLRLVTPEGTRRVVEQQEIVENLGPRSERVLKHLSDARLLSVRSDEDVVQYELSHESLVDTWGRLRRWLDEGREESIFLDELAQAAALWTQRGRRKAETWTGEALAGALRSIDRFGLHLSPTAKAFIDTSQQAERSRKRRRHAVLGMVVVLLALVAVVSTVKEREAERQRQIASKQRAQADAEGARSALLAGKPLEARARLRRSLETSDSALARTLWHELSYEPLLWQMDFGRGIYAASITPDGKWIAVGDTGGVVSLIDADTATEHASLDSGGGKKTVVVAVVISTDGRRVAFGTDHGDVGVWDVSKQTAVRKDKQHQAEVSEIRFSLSENEVISASPDGSILVWDIGAGTPRPLAKTGAAVSALALDVNGQVAAGRSDGTLQIWKSIQGSSPRTLRRFEAGIDALAFAPGSAGDLAAGLNDGRVAILDLDDNTVVAELARHTGFVSGLRYGKDGKKLFSAAYDQRVLAWDITTGRVLASFDGHEGGIFTLDLDASGTRLVSGGYPDSLRLWDSSLLVRKDASTGHLAETNGIDVSPDGRWVVSASTDHTVRVWDIASGETMATGAGHEDVVMRVAISPDGQRALSSSQDGTVRIWLLPSAKLERVLVGHAGGTYGVAFLGADRIVTTGWDGTVRLWGFDGTPLGIFTIGEPAVAVATSRDAKLIIAGGYNGAIRLWRAPFRGPSLQRDAGLGVTSYLAFSSNSRTVAAAADPGGVAIWEDITDVAPPRIFTYPEDNPDALAFAPDGKHIMVGHRSGQIARLDVQSGVASPWSRQPITVNGMAFSADGRVLASSGGPDCTVRTWRTNAPAPAWRLGIVLTEPYDGAFTHRGWLDTQAATDGNTKPKWRKAVETSPWGAVQKGQRACILTTSKGVELWDLNRDEVLVEASELKAKTVRVVPRGCLVVDDRARAWLITEDAKPIMLAESVGAVGSDVDGPLVATVTQIIAYDANGRVVRKSPGRPGATAVARVGARLAVGSADGSIELRSWDGRSRRRLRSTMRNPVTFLAEGTRETVMAGYVDGHFGIWQQDNSIRLLLEKLHGAVVKVHQRGSLLRIASDLGEIRDIDLSAFDIPYCELLSRVLSSVPVTWSNGIPVPSLNFHAP